jgi:hypothetical protein
MHREFSSCVESIADEGGRMVVKFMTSPGGYAVRDEPREVGETIREALRSGRRVRVTCEMATQEIVDAVLE